MNTSTNQPSKPRLAIPPLESGDRLTRSEFERRYEGNSHIKKAELIEGVVYVASPLRFERHANPHARLITWLGVYEAATPGSRLGDTPTVRLDLDNEPQPDAVLLLLDTVGGQARLSADDYVEGAPELIAEIAASSATYDLGDKKTAYRRNQVREYLVWQIFENKLDWFVLQDSEYALLQPDQDGVIRSRVFPGLWLAVEALLKGDMMKVLAVLQLGLQSREHGEFVQRLGQAE